MVLQAVLSCGGCTACCKRDRIFLGPTDDPRAFRWHLEGRYAVLDRKDNGECVYLTEHGCSIHGAQPAICRRFDCRELVQMTPPDVRAARVRDNPTLQQVYEAGLARLDTQTF
jgi:Fe-S-cluster containining protein